MLKIRDKANPHPLEGTKFAIKNDKSFVYTIKNVSKTKRVMTLEWINEEDLEINDCSYLVEDAESNFADGFWVKL